MKTVSIALLLLVAFIGLLHWVKPLLAYNHDGSLRDFGVGYVNRTVTPVWLLALAAAILSYGAATYFNGPSDV